MRWGLALLPALLLLPGAGRADERWDQYQVLMWQDRTPAQMAGLPALGFTGTKLGATSGQVNQDGKAGRAAAGLSWYLENIATDFYSPYHRYTAGKPVTWLFDAAKAAYRAGDPAAFDRMPSLSDAGWLAQVSARLDRVVRAETAGRPLFYNLADEAGIADVAAAWDFDRSPAGLAGLRAWLRTRYADLAALNRQWGTAFADWDAVVPELTDAAVRRGDENFSAWSDGKAWMDVAFARAVQAGTDAAHAADPAALVALEGAQVPGWGGYDYSLLAPAVDVMEIYDVGDSLDLAQAFHPKLIPLRTSFARGPREAHAVWRTLLHGGRGLVVWDEADDVVQADGRAGPRGAELGALTAAIRPVATLLRGMDPDPDPVAVLYSPASFRVQWLLDRRAGDHDWAERDAEREYDDNPTRAARRVMLERLGALAVQPRLVSGAMIGGLWGQGVRVLLLPHAIALSDAEVADIGAFRAAGGTVLADTQPGLFDGHGRRRDALPLGWVARPEAVRNLGGPDEPGLLGALAALLEQAGAAPRVTLLGPDGARATGVEARWFRQQGRRVLALQSARPWGGMPIRVRFPEAVAVDDARVPGRAVGEILLDSVEPTLLSIR